MSVGKLVCLSVVRSVTTNFQRSKEWVLLHIVLMHNSICNMQFAICNMHYALCNMQYALCNMHYAICIMQYALCNIHYAMFIMQYALCNIHYAIFIMQYALCIMQYAQRERESHTHTESQVDPSAAHWLKREKLAVYRVSLKLKPIHLQYPLCPPLR